MKILLAVDGSDCSRLAIKYVIKRWNSFGDKPQVTLVHVDPPLLRRVAVALGRAEVERYHAENADAALADARRAFKRAQLVVGECAVVGDAGETIAGLADKGKYDLLVMGSHGNGTFRNLILGSVVTKVIAASRVPVLIVR